MIGTISMVKRLLIMPVTLKARGLVILAYNYMYSCSDYTHYYATIVNREISVGGSVGGTVGAGASTSGTWQED